MDLKIGSTVLYENKFYTVENIDFNQVELINSNTSLFCLPEEVKLISCPCCDKPLNSLGKFDSIPCHFSYKEDAPDFLIGELFECDNEACELYEEVFYVDFSKPGEIFEGRPEGV